MDLAEALLEQLVEAVWVVDGGERVTYASRGACRILGAPRESIVGRLARDVMPPPLADRALSAHRGAMQGREAEFDVAVDGLVLNVRVTPLGGQGVSAARALDVTRARAEVDRLRLITHGLDRSPDGAYLLGPDGRMRYVNDAASRALGYSKEELLTMTIPDIDPDFPPERWVSFWEDLRERRQMFISTRHRTKDGRTYPVEVVAYYFVFDGAEYDFAFARDVSERVRAAEERKALEERMRQTQKLESLGILAGGIAHDFNNLLVPILCNAELAARGLEPESKARGYCAAIEAAAHRAADLCRQMLAYSGRGNFVVEPIDVNALVREMAEMLHLAIARNVSLVVDFREPLPRVVADATQIRQVVMNLITNASDAMASRGGEIRVATEVVTCDRDYLSGARHAEGLPEGDYVCVEVSDTGSGMDEVARERLFEPFFTTKFTGRGLGLAAVLGIVRAHRGAIRVDSEAGRGTTMRVLLPATDSPPRERSSPEAAPPEMVAGGTVLLVDDDPAVREAGRGLLEALGFDVVTAEGGSPAVRVWTEHARRIVCVVLDLTMPDGDGEACYRELRRRAPELPVVLCSGYHEQEAMGAFAGQGLAGFLQKPFDMASMKRALERALAGARSATEVVSPPS